MFFSVHFVFIYFSFTYSLRSFNFSSPSLYEFYTILILYCFSTFVLLFSLVFLRFTPIHFSSVRFTLIHFSSVRFTTLQTAFQTYFFQYSHPAARPYCDLLCTPTTPLSHPIGVVTSHASPTLLCCPVSLSVAFFPARNLDPWRWDRHVVPKRR
jgi:hypothetical protein